MKRKNVVALLTEMNRRYDAIFVERQKAIDAALDSAKGSVAAALQAVKESVRAKEDSDDRAIHKAEDLVKERLESHNQIRPWIEAKLETVMTKVVNLNERFTRVEDRKAGLSAGAKVIVAVVSFLITLITLGGLIWGLLHTR